MILLFIIHTLMISFCPLTNADHTIVRDTNDLPLLSESVATGPLNIYKMLGINSSISMEELKQLNIKSLLGDLSFTSVLKDVVNGMNYAAFPNVSSGCMQAGMKLLLPIIMEPDPTVKIMKLLTSPVGKMIDAWGKPPPRILLGNLMWTGAPDECIAIEEAHVCFSTALLLAKYPITYGSCLPKECTEDDVGKILAMLNGYTKGIVIFLPGAVCEKPMEKYEAGTILTMVVLVVILALCIFSTLIDVIDNKQSSLSHPVDSTSDPAPAPSKQEEKSRGWCRRILSCFSLIKNTKALLSTESKEGSITNINGIRVLSITWVVLGHTYVFYTTLKPDNILDLLKEIQSFTKQAIVNATVSVDSFFLMSGLLVGYLTLKKIDARGMGWKDVLLYYLHRFLRLTPSYALVIAFYTNILIPLMLPHYVKNIRTTVKGFQQPCLDYWWTDMLYINNFYPEELGKECYGVAWYLANDMQFYVIAPGILLLLVQIEKRFNRGKLYNLIFILVLCSISIMITGIIIGVGDVLVIGSDPLNPARGGLGQDRVYIKPYCRITPYLIGLFLGYVFSRKITINTGSKKLIVVIGWVTAAVTALAIIYGPWHNYKYNNGEFSFTENLMYGMFARFAWGLVLAWVIFACHTKAYVMYGFVDKLLSWKLWIPLARLSYGVYLLHIMVLTFFYMHGYEHGMHYNDTIVVFEYISVTTISFACSYILTVCVDYPVSNLENMMFKR